MKPPTDRSHERHVLPADFAKVRAALRRDPRTQRGTLTGWLVGMFLVEATAILGGVYFMLTHFRP